jgi:hypothetical protein
VRDAYGQNPGLWPAAACRDGVPGSRRRSLLGDEEEKSAKAAVAALTKAEQAGRPAELFMAYRFILGNECLDRYDKTALSRAKTGVPKLGRDLAKAAEAKGLLYSADPVRSDGQTSAFRYFEDHRGLCRCESCDDESAAGETGRSRALHDGLGCG